MPSLELDLKMPAGLARGEGGIDPVLLSAKIVERVGPVFHRLVEQIRATTEDENIRAGWVEQPPTSNSSETVFVALNEHPAASIWEFGSAEHEIPQPPHWVPIRPLIEFYENTRGLPPSVARAAAYGFQAWASENTWTIHHPGTAPHGNVTAAWQGITAQAQDAAIAAFAEAAGQRIAG